MKLVKVSFWLIVIFTLSSILLDILVWRQVFLKGQQGSDSYQAISQITRFLRTLLILGFVPYILKHGTPKTRFIALTIAFVLAVIADFFLILEQELIIGIAFFALMQITLCYRHLKGFKLHYLKFPRFFSPALISIGVWAVAIALLKPGLEASGLFLPVMGYGLLLVGSVWAAYSAIQLKVFSPRSAKFAFWAMICFLLCDITVGLGAIWADTSRGELIRALTGVFYTPCLLLLAKSAKGITNIRLAG